MTSIADRRHTAISVSNDSARTRVIQLCEGYVSHAKEFTYGYKNAAFRNSVKKNKEKWEINCSTFSMLVALGIPFEKSSYTIGTNDIACNNSIFTNLHAWFSEEGNIKYSRDMAELFDKQGYGFVPNDDLSNLDTGDILFFNLDPSNDRPGIDYMGVDHSAIFGYPFGNRFVVYEVGDDDGPKRALKEKKTMEKVVLAVRLPQHDDQQDYSPRILAVNHQKIRVKKKSNESNHFIVECPLKEPLTKDAVYTMVIQAKIGKNNWMNATIDDTREYAFNLTNVKTFRPDNHIYVIHFTAPSSIKKLSLNVRNKEGSDADAVYYGSILYSGMVTNPDFHAIQERLI